MRNKKKQSKLFVNDKLDKYKLRNNKNKKKNWAISLISFFTLISVPLISFGTYSVTKPIFQELTKEVVPVDPEILSDQVIANELSSKNSILSINDPALSSKLPSLITINDLTVENIGINYSHIKNIDVNLISFEIISFSNVDGNLKLNLFYNKVKSNINELLVSGFTKEEIINIVKEPQSVSLQEKLNASIFFTISYQNVDVSKINFNWYKDNVLVANIPNKIDISFTNSSDILTSSLNIFNLDINDAGNYKCVVTTPTKTINSKLSNIKVTNDISIDFEKLVSQNIEIDVKNSQLKNIYPSQVNVNSLVAQNLVINSTGLLGFDPTQLFFTDISNVNDNMGTLNAYIYYNGQKSLFPSTIKGFLKLPSTIYVNIIPSRSDKGLQEYVNGIFDGSIQPVENFFYYVTVKDFFTSSTLSYNYVISSVVVTKKIISTSKIEMKFTFMMRPNHTANVSEFSFQNN